MNPYAIIKQMKKASIKKDQEIKELKKELKELDKENDWLRSRVKRLLK